MRWSIDSEPDLHFRLRPHFTRRTSCRCGCAAIPRYTRSFRAGAVATDHLLNSNQWTLISQTFAFSRFDRFSDRYRHPPLPSTTPPLWCPRKGAPTHSLDHLDPALRSWIDLPCVLCGHGDNSVQHWMRFCPVPALVGSALLNRPWCTHDWSLRPTFSASRLAMIGTLWVGTRQFVHKRSGLSPLPLLRWMILSVLRNTSWIVLTHLSPNVSSLPYCSPSSSSYYPGLLSKPYKLRTPHHRTRGFFQLLRAHTSHLPCSGRSISPTDFA